MLKRFGSSLYRATLKQRRCLEQCRHLSKSNSSEGETTSVTAETDASEENGRKVVPRRAVLYVPGDDSRKIAKAENLDVDCVVLDCEDGVAANRKV